MNPQLHLEGGLSGGIGSPVPGTDSEDVAGRGPAQGGLREHKASKRCVIYVIRAQCACLNFRFADAPHRN
jgi:hypothetical protein